MRMLFGTYCKTSCRNCVKKLKIFLKNKWLKLSSQKEKFIVCNRFENKVAIITGSGRGIGREVAVGIAKGKGKVVVHDRDAEPANETLQEIKKLGGEAIVVTGDVTKHDDVARLFSEGIGKFGKIDIVVNNAGVTNTAMAHKMTEEEWDYVVDI